MTLDEALDSYWAAAYSEGKRGATHDTTEGLAQTALSAVISCVRLGLAAERERCSAEFVENGRAIGRAEEREASAKRNLALATDLREFIYRCASQVPFEHAQWANERGEALLFELKRPNV